jgi:ech hydrogenase subunit C
MVIAVGTCATSGGVFHNCYNVLGGVDKVIPVDVYVPGCAARPEAIIDGVVMALQSLTEQRRQFWTTCPHCKTEYEVTDQRWRI